jgi:uncharacterized phage-associated protein
MPRPYRPLAFANEFILKSQGVGIEHMKLQKLVYYAYAWWLGYHNDPILSEPPQVWRYGPVFSSLYHALKGFGRTPIADEQSDYPFQPPPRVDQSDVDAWQLINWVWQRYGGFTSYQLSEMTHAPGSPWRQIAEQTNWHVAPSTPIPDDLIREHIKQEAQRMGLVPQA